MSKRKTKTVDTCTPKHRLCHEDKSCWCNAAVFDSNHELWTCWTCSRKLGHKGAHIACYPVSAMHNLATSNEPISNGGNIIVIEMVEAKPPYSLNSGDVRGPFADIAAAEKWIKEDSEISFNESPEDVKRADPKSWGSVCVICEIKKFCKTVPNITAVMELNTLADPVELKDSFNY